MTATKRGPGRPPVGTRAMTGTERAARARRMQAETIYAEAHYAAECLDKAIAATRGWSKHEAEQLATVRRSLERIAYLATPKERRPKE